MAMQAYLTINMNSISKGASGSNSLGQVASTDTNNQDKITVVGYMSDTQIPLDPNSGVATGSRIYNPFTITKYFDSASPLLWSALANNLVIDELLLEVYRPDPSGASKPQLYFTIDWKKVTLVEGKGYTPLVINPQNSFYQWMEDWSFTCKTVQWDHKISNTTGSDNW